MAATVLHCLLHRGVFSLFLVSLMTAEVLGNNGVCTRTQVVTKTKPKTYYKTFMENYYDTCYGGYYRGHYHCLKTRSSRKKVTDEESYTELETKQECCAGWTSVGCGSSPCPLKCDPVCDFTCSNGNCTAPNHCECNSGYVKTPGTENICEPVCSQECVHGYCSEPDYCSCDFKYEHNHNISTSNYVCSPVCSTPCINADCTSPDVCSCFQGFAKTMYDPHKCHAQCSPPCHNGVCASPNECTCFQGYEKENSTWNVCNPVCSEGCTNGACTSPEVCTCYDGFTKIDNTCEPICTQGCLNGVCTGPEICSCFPGYKSNSEDPYSCFPVCSPECVNGNCTEPDRCECFPGYEETDNPTVCRPYCSDGCENGVCSHPEECTCLWGFQSSGNSSNCTKRGDENLDCAFVSKIVNHDFDKNCFKLTSELLLNKLGNCQIFQFLVTTFLEEDNKVLDLYCEQISNLELIRNVLHLKLECSVKLNDKEENFKEFSSTTLAYTEDFSTEFELTTQDYSLDTLTTDDQINTETSAVKTTSTYTLNEIEQEHGEFEIIYDESSVKETKLSDSPLNLNIILKFFSLIESSQMAHDYFNNVTNSEGKWCLCHKNQKNWNICAFSPLHLHVCSCQPSDPHTLVEDSRISPILKTVAMFVVITMAAVFAVYILYRIYQSGTYTTNGTEGTTTSREPVLSIDLDSSIEEENT